MAIREKKTKEIKTVFIYRLENCRDQRRRNNERPFLQVLLKSESKT